MRTESMKLSRKLLTVGAASLILASQAFAQDQSQAKQMSGTANAAQQQNPEFQSMDQDQDQLLVWREIHVVMDPRILAAGLDQEQIFEEYDENQDDALDEQEFDQFVSGLQAAEGSANPTAMSGAGQQGQDATTGVQQNNGTGSSAMNRDLTPTMGGQPGEAASAQRQASEGTASESIGGTDESLSVDETEYDTQADTRISDAEPIATFEEPNDTAVSGTAGGTTNTSLGSASGDNTQPSVSDDAAADTDITTGTAGSAAAAGAAGATAGASGNAANSPAATGMDTSSQANVNAASEPTGQPQPTASVETSEPQSIYQMPIDELKDKSVVNSAGEKIGSVEQVVVNNQSGEAGLVVSSGGMMGIGSSKLLAPVSEVTISGDNITWQTSKDKKALKDSEKFDSQNYQEVSENYETLGEIGSEGLSAR